jgi:hypothetical protein
VVFEKKGNAADELDDFINDGAVDLFENIGAVGGMQLTVAEKMGPYSIRFHWHIRVVWIRVQDRMANAPRIEIASIVCSLLEKSK